MANLATVTDIQPGTALASGLGTSVMSILAGPSDASKVIKITSIIVANVDGTNDCDFSCFTDIYPNYCSIAKTVTVPADSTLVVLSKDNYIYLPYNPNGTSLKVQASASGDLDVVVTYEEITCSSV